MLCGAWEAGSLGVGTTGQHLWGLTAFQKAFPQNSRLCVAQERSSALLGAQERRSPRSPLL